MTVICSIITLSLNIINLANLKFNQFMCLQEVLSHLQHYNAGMKHDALQGLKELITTDPSILQSHLPVILERLSELFVDKDNVVRSAVLKILKNVFHKISLSQLRPFFPVISAHICCAMTHIQDDIQLDSLPLLDLCLELYPSLVISSTSQLLPNFIEQISHQSQSGNGSKAKERTLLVNPNSKLSSKKWRIKVLDRLTHFLKALADNQVLPNHINLRNQEKITFDVHVKETPYCFVPVSAQVGVCGSGFSLRLVITY